MKPGWQFRIGSLLIVILLVASVAGLALETTDSSAVRETNVSSTFDADDSGWVISGDAQGESAEPTYMSDGGSPGGHICAKDNAAGGTWYFSAPSRFLGPMDNYYNGTLTFDLRQSSTSNQFDQNDIELGNGTHTIVYDFGNKSTHPGTNWTAFSIPLSANDEAWTFAQGGSVSAAEFRGILANLSSLRIRGEYVSGSDRGCLDSVRLETESTVSLGSPPETSVTIDDQTAQDSGTLVVIRSITLESDGFVSIRKNNATGEVVGTSGYLSAGSFSSVQIRLDAGSAVNNAQTLVAVVHNDTNHNQVFDYTASNGAHDGAFRLNGEPISDSATVSYFTPTPSPTPSPTTTDTPSPTSTQSPSPTPIPTPTLTTTSLTTGQTTTADTPGFNLVVTVVGLLLASMLFARRSLNEGDE